MPTTASARRVARHTSLTKETFRAARSRAIVPCHTNPYAAHLAKDLLSRESEPRRRSMDHTAALVADLAHRGSLEDAESPGQLLIAIARHEHALAHPETANPHPLSIEEAHIAEEQAEGIVEEWETRMAHDASPSNCLGYLAARAAHRRTCEVLDEAVRAAIVAQNATE
jgi:hypothetical protein